MDGVADTNRGPGDSGAKASLLLRVCVASTSRGGEWMDGWMDFHGWVARTNKMVPPGITLVIECKFRKKD